MSIVVTLLIDSQPVPVLCHLGNFGCGDGGWTPVMKIDGTKVHILKSKLFTHVINKWAAWKYNRVDNELELEIGNILVWRKINAFF